jgi:hypothetical protein
MNSGPAEYLKTEIPGRVTIGSDLEGRLRHDPALEIRLRNISLVIGEKNPRRVAQEIKDFSGRHMW